MTVLVPVYKGSKHLDGLLKALERDPYPDKEVIISVDAPTDETRALESAYPWVRFRWSEKRRGKVNALNEEIAKSHGDYLLFIDSDIKITEAGFLGKVAEALRDNELVDIKKVIIRDSLMAKLVSYEYLSGSLTSYIFDTLNGSCPQLNGACFAIRRTTFERLGGFNRVLYEDLDLAFRAFQSSVSYSFADDIVVMNAVDPKIESWLRQRRRWGIGLVKWIKDNLKGLLMGVHRDPFVFLAAFFVLSPSSLLIAAILLFSADSFANISSLGILLSSYGLYRIPSFFPGQITILKTIAMMFASYLSSSIVFFVAARRLNYKFNPLEFMLYFFLYYPIWFSIILLSIVRVLLKKEPSELDWKV